MIADGTAVEAMMLGLACSVALLFALLYIIRQT
jgi:hypothetical protein